MSQNVWEPLPDTAAPRGGEPVAKGGELPSVADLLMAAIKDLTGDFAGFLLAGLGLVVATVPLSIAGAVLLIGLMVPGVVMEDELVLMGGMLFGFGGMMALILMAVGPLYGSLYRAVWGYLVRGEKLGFGACFATLFEGAGAMIGLMLLISGMSVLGVFACYVGTLLVALFTDLAMPAVAIHRMSPLQAIGFSFRHVRQNLTWHLGYWALGFAIVMVAANIPIIGIAIGVPLYVTYQLRGYRALFGDEMPDEGFGV